MPRICFKTWTPKTVRHWWKELNETQISGKIPYVNGLEELIVLKCVCYLKQYIYSAQPLSKFWCHFSQVEKSILEFVWNHKKSQIAKAILEKKNKTGSITFPDFKLYYKAKVIKAIWYWQKKQTHRSTEQNRELQNKLKHLWWTNFQLRETRTKNIQRETSILFNK